MFFNYLKFKETIIHLYNKNIKKLVKKNGKQKFAKFK